MRWEKGIAFVHGINMFSNNRINQEGVFDLCKKIENENIKILKIIKTDNIIFKKRRVHYAQVGNLIEKVLSGYFNKKIFVTTRSLTTLNRCLKKERERVEGVKV